MRFVSFLLVLICSTSQAIVLSQYTGFGMVAVTSDQADMWDKKNEAVKEAKKKLVAKLLQKHLKPEVIEENSEKLEKMALVYSDRYILKTDVLKHGLEEDGDFKSYQARVRFDYSLDNFKDLLKSQGVLYSDLHNPKVAAFIEVLDLDEIEHYTWWKGKSPKVHSSVKPIYHKLKEALKEEGYELLPIKAFHKDMSLQAMSLKMNAHYFINGNIKVKKSGNGLRLTDGKFFFHETLSQNMVSKIDVVEFKKTFKTPSRGLASVGKQDFIKEAFKDAVRVLNTVGDEESLTQGLVTIELVGLKTPSELKDFKNLVLQKMPSRISALTERRLEPGKVTLFARTNKQNISLMNDFNRQFRGMRASLKEDGSGIRIVTRPQD